MEAALYYLWLAPTLGAVFVALAMLTGMRTTLVPYAGIAGAVVAVPLSMWMARREARRKAAGEDADTDA